MMRALLLAGLCGLAADAAAQSLSLGFRVGAERYALSSLRDWQTEELRRLRFSVPADGPAFPAHLAFGVEIGAATSPYGRIGLVLRYGSTGGSTRYADPTGEIGSEWRVQRRSAGLFGETDVARFGPYVALFGLHALADFGRLEYQGAIVASDEEWGDDTPPTATNRTFSVEPEVGVERRFGRMGVRARFGFGISTKEKLTLAPASSVIGGVNSSSGGSWHPNGPYSLPSIYTGLDWTGWRFGLTFVHRR